MIVRLLRRLQVSLIYHLWPYVPVCTLVVAFDGPYISSRLHWLKNTRYYNNPSVDETWAYIDEKCFIDTSRRCLMFEPVLGVFARPVLVYRGGGAVPFEFGTLGGD